jgi:hypothetical protein
MFAMKLEVKWLITILTLWLSAYGLMAQQAEPRQCASQNYITSTEAGEIVEANQKKIRDYLQSPGLAPRQQAYIPLVFHIVLKEGSDSIAMDEILDQIEVLNECFGAENQDLAHLDPDFREVVHYAGPKFCLAKKESAEGSMPGMETKFVSVDDFAELVDPNGRTYIKSSILGGFDAWDPEHYVNIWIGDLNFAQGKSTFPNTVEKEESGLIIDPDYFGVHDPASSFYPFHLGKTLVHEMGHYFNLKHPWGDESNCQSDDGIEDTPLQGVIYTGCPEGKQYSCGSADMYQNFMNFTDDDCLIHFTQEQMSHMLAAIDLFYPELYSDNYCYAPIVNEDPLDEIEISYSPGNRSILFTFDNAVADKIYVSLFQLDGKRVLTKTIFQESREEIQLNLIPAGIYVLFLRTENNFSSRKLFVY